jgi:hypothetical protein
MSPLGSPCPHIVESGDFIFCGIYDSRPEECVNHKFHSCFCPIGMDVLKLRDADSVRKRIDDGWEKAKEIDP